MRSRDLIWELIWELIRQDFILKKQNVRRFCQRVPKLARMLDAGDITQKRYNASIQGWKGHAVQANTFRLRQGLEGRFFELELLLTD